MNLALGQYDSIVYLLQQGHQSDLPMEVKTPEASVTFKLIHLLVTFTLIRHMRSQVNVQHPIHCSAYYDNGPLTHGHDFDQPLSGAVKYKHWKFPACFEVGTKF